jgi:Zn-finger nucleic acid-binding protein
MSNTMQGMQCPVCRVNLVMSDRQGIEIDYCPQCRGVWLDRGELDKIIERSLPAQQAQPQAQPQPQAQQPYPQQPSYPPQPTGYPQQPYGHHPYPHKRRKSFLEELFD